MQLYPTQDYVLVEILDPEYISPSGLKLPEIRKKVFKGKIIAIASGVRGKDGERLPIDPDVKIGRIMWFDRFMGIDFDVDGKKIRFMKPDQFMFYMDESEVIEAELEAMSDPHSHIPPDPEQVSRETSSFFIPSRIHELDIPTVQGRTHESADKDA